MSHSSSKGPRPLNADVLMIGVDPDHFDHYQRMVKGGFQSMNMGWCYVANLSKTFADAVEFLAKRPELDMVYLTNEIKLAKSDMLAGASAVALALSTHPAKPWVALGSGHEYLLHLFESHGVRAECCCIEDLTAERHRHLSQSEAA